MEKKDLALNNQNQLICHKTKKNQPYTFKYIHIVLTQTNVGNKLTCPFQECLSENEITPIIYIGLTTTTHSRRLTLPPF